DAHEESEGDPYSLPLHGEGGRRGDRNESRPISGNRPAAPPWLPSRTFRAAIPVGRSRRRRPLANAFRDAGNRKWQRRGRWLCCLHQPGRAGQNGRRSKVVGPSR
ncbi:unnamed protein product, partial [Amoebophrya sp. A120]